MSDNATHIVIPDTQVKPGVSTRHLSWIGRYIVDQFAGQRNVKVVHLGDHWDMPSLSSYDQRYNRRMEGRRVLADIEAGNDGFGVLNEPLVAKYNKTGWWPELHLLRGNHEDRIQRAIDEDAQKEGLLSLDMLDSAEWEVHDFLVPVDIDGVMYAHYFYNPLTGRPYTGMIGTRLRNIGHTFTMGHQQTLDYGLRYVGKTSQHGLVAGACYLHDEDYKGPQGNSHWRGIVVCHEVRHGSYDPMFVSLDYLCRRYEGKSLSSYTKSKL